MNKQEAKDQIFLLAFEALSKREQESVIENLLNNSLFKEELLDIVTIQQRKEEPSRSFRQYLLEKQKS